MENISIDSKNYLKTFIRYVLLNMVSVIGVSVYFLADTYFIANGVNSNGVVALNLALPMYSIIYGVAQTFAIGSGALYSVSQEEEYKKKIIVNCIVWGILLELLFTIVIQVFLDPLSILLGAKSSEVLQYTKDYLGIISKGAVFFLSSAILCSLTRNFGNPKIVMVASFIGSMSNVLFDWLYIYIFKMGMFGAGLATITSPILTSILILPTFIKSIKHLNITKQDILKCISFRTSLNIVKVGFSAFINELSSGVTILVFNMVLLQYLGEIGVAGYGIIANIALVYVAFFNGVATGVQPLISSLYGKGDYSTLKKCLRLALIFEIVIGALFVAYSFAFTNPTILIFNKDRDQTLQQIAYNGLRLYFCGYVMTGIDICLVSYFASVIEPLKSTILSSMRGFAVIIPMILILPHILGVNGIWLSVPFTDALTLIVGVTMLIFSLKKYKKSSKV